MKKNNAEATNRKIFYRNHSYILMDSGFVKTLGTDDTILGPNALNFALTAKLNGIGLGKVFEYFESNDRVMGSPMSYPEKYKDKPICTFTPYACNLDICSGEAEKFVQGLEEVLQKNAITNEEADKENLIFGVIWIQYQIRKLT